MIKDVIDVYMAFVGVLDPGTATKACPLGFSFFKAGHEELLKTQLAYIAKGCLSDLPDRCMYISIGVHPTTGLEIFKCIRGSNDLEGASIFSPPPFIVFPFPHFEPPHSQPFLLQVSTRTCSSTCARRRESAWAPSF